jgi:hypothetical protein
MIIAWSQQDEWDLMQNNIEIIKMIRERDIDPAYG